MGNVKLANLLKTLAEVELRQYEMDKTIESLRQDQENKMTVCREQLRNCWAREKDEEYFSSSWGGRIPASRAGGIGWSPASGPRLPGAGPGHR